jgi:hypothetical protein
VDDAIGVWEDLNQLIRVCLTNNGDIKGFIAANYPKEYALYTQGSKVHAPATSDISDVESNEYTVIHHDAKDGASCPSAFSTEIREVMIDGVLCNKDNSIMGEGSNREDFENEANKPPLLSSSPATSESLVVDKDDIFDELACSDGVVEIGNQCIILVEDAFEVLKPYLRTTKPVSVHLKNSAMALAALDYDRGHVTASYEDSALYAAENWLNYAGEAKAVLDAAGVAYVS